MSWHDSALMAMLRECADVARGQYGHKIVLGSPRMMAGADALALETCCSECIAASDISMTMAAITSRSASLDSLAKVIAHHFKTTYGHECVLDRYGVLAAGVTRLLHKIGPLPHDEFIRAWEAGGGTDGTRAAKAALQMELIDHEATRQWYETTRWLPTGGFTLPWLGLPPEHPWRKP